MSKVKFDKTIKNLKGKEKILFLLTSNRWDGHDEIPKSSALAYKMQEELGKNAVTIIDVAKLKIHSCEGNVSSREGNGCGVKESQKRGKSVKALPPLNYMMDFISLITSRNTFISRISS